MMPLPSFDPDFASNREWADLYRECGLQVVPCRPREKQPALKEWRNLTDGLIGDDAFRFMFDSIPPAYGLGILTGSCSGNVFVVDLDLHKPVLGPLARAWWAMVTNGAEIRTPTQRTGGGGLQILLRAPDDVRMPTNKTNIGVDFRGQGGFAVLAPTLHASGKTYEWLPGLAPWEVEIAEASQDIIEAVFDCAAEHGGTPGGTRTATDTPVTDLSAFGKVQDGRESYMAAMVFAALVTLRTESAIRPSPQEMELRARAEFATYERNVASRLPADSRTNAERLEEEGRGWSAFWFKWQRAARKWDDKIAEEAAKRVPPKQDIPSGELILSAADFVAGFTPPEYLVDGMIQQGYLYSLTARTGHGKTAVSLYLAQCVALGRQVKDRVVKQGSVLFLAGENPDDIRARLLVLADAMDFDPRTTPIYFIPGVVDLAACMPKIRAEAEGIPDLSLVIVDTAAAYFKGDDGNSNAQMGEYARLLRQLSFLPGKPAVVVPSHPVKNAGKENLLPAGGGAFLNEVDGNLTLWGGAEKQTTLHWQGKFRGPEFEPLTFKLETHTSETVVNASGELMPSVVAVPVSDFESEAAAAKTESDENVLMGVIGMNKPLSVAQLAMKANFIGETGQPQKSKVFNLCRRLLEDKLVELHRGKYRLTAKGRKEIGFDE
jgi:hypothetical protein